MVVSLRVHGTEPRLGRASLLQSTARLGFTTSRGPRCLKVGLLVGEKGAEIELRLKV